jgi:hypothetical protein
MAPEQVGNAAAVTKRKRMRTGERGHITAPAGNATISRSILCPVEAEVGMSRSVGTTTAV